MGTIDESEDTGPNKSIGWAIFLGGVLIGCGFGILVSRPPVPRPAAAPVLPQTHGEQVGEMITDELARQRAEAAAEVIDVYFRVECRTPGMAVATAVDDAKKLAARLGCNILLTYRDQELFVGRSSDTAAIVARYIDRVEHEARLKTHGGGP